MPEVKESELAGNEGMPCIDCDDFEGAIYLCGSGMICERCFSTLAEIPEEALFSNDEPILDYQNPERAHRESQGETDAAEDE